MFDLSTKFPGVLKKCQLFQATDFQSLMGPCFIFSHILGIFPYKISASTFKISKPHYVLSIVVTCAVCVFHVTLFYYTILTNYVKVDLDLIPWFFDEICYYTFSCFITIVTYILSGPRMRLLQNIMNVSLKLPSETCKKLSRMIHTKDILGFFFLVVMVVITCNERNYEMGLELYTMYIILIVFLMDMLYLNCVCILKACFKRINDNLANLGESVIKNAPHLSSRNQERNSFLLMELKALKKQHLMISDVVQMLNLIFSLHLVSSIIIIFGDLTVILYFYALRWTGLTYKLDYSYTHSVFMMYYFLKISSIAWACETGKNQALEIGTTINVLLNSISDEEVKDEVM